MQAWLSHAPGGPETLALDDVAPPSPVPGQAIVEVHACGVNFPDLLLIAGKYQQSPDRPFAPGGEIAGIVQSVGADVTHVAAGDRVLANIGWGGLAEQVGVESDRVVRIPDAMPFDQGAAFITTYGTSYHALTDRAQLMAGETVLVLGASGGVGIAALDLALTLGARAIAACSTQEKVDFCLARGAQGGIVYGDAPTDRDSQRALTQRLKQATGGAGVDIVFDAVGGGYAEPALRAIAWGGRYLVVGFATGAIPSIPLNLLLLNSAQAIGVFYGEWAVRDPAAYQRGARELLNLYEQGRVRPAIDRRYSFAEARRAFSDLGRRSVKGKLVVTLR